MLADPLLLERLTTFVRGIGIAVRAATLPTDIFLPVPAMLRWLR
jgi:hypothetical protein